MFRALFWKEWRQLALVRWGGFALGAVLPVAFGVGAELATHGLLPTGSVTSYSLRDLTTEALPATLAFALWPLIGLMAAAQAFLGDRAEGTETFLLERPVPRSAVWSARLVAASGTLVVVIAATAAITAVAAAATGLRPGVGWSQIVPIASWGLVLTLLAFVGGLVASSLPSTPLVGILLGLLFGGLPLLLGAQLAIGFQFARIGGTLSLGAVVPGLLIPSYIVTSWLALCRGEPAGRGRAKRALTVVGAAIACVLIAFVALAPLAVRAGMAMGGHFVHPAPAGSGAFVGSLVGSGTGGWIVDVGRGTKRAFVSPPVRGLAWSPDGSKVAVVTWSGPLGSMRGGARIDVQSSDDGRVLRSIPVAEDVTVQDLTWADAGLVAIVTDESSPGRRELAVTIIDPVTGAWRPTGFRSGGWSLALIGPAADRSVFLRKLVEENLTPGSSSSRGCRLYPVDVAAARVGPPMTDVSGGPLTFAGLSGGLSPSGRFAQVVGAEDSDEGRIVDLRVGPAPLPGIIPSRAQWLSGDRLIWQDELDGKTRLLVASPGEAPKVLREWRDARVGIEPSPDGNSVFVFALPTGETRATEELVYVPNEDRFVEIGPPFSRGANDLRSTEWAGPGTLARIAPGVVYFEDLDAPGKRRFVIGGPRNLE